jgi:hypothetical protein
MGHGRPEKDRLSKIPEESNQKFEANHEQRKMLPDMDLLSHKEDTGVLGPGLSTRVRIQFYALCLQAG